MRAALAAQDEVLRTVIEAHGGFLFKHTGDRVCAGLREFAYTSRTALLTKRSAVRSTNHLVTKRA
jgi:hypothetical protein